MRIKRFEAPDMKTALFMVKDEMGDDAVILSSKTLTHGGGGGSVKKYGKSYVEVVAARDYDLESLVESAVPGKLTDTAGTAAVVYDSRATVRNFAPTPEAVEPGLQKTKRANVDRGGEQTASVQTGVSGSEEQHLRKRFSNMLRRRGVPQPSAASCTSSRSRNKNEAGRSATEAKSRTADVAKWRDNIIANIKPKTLRIGGQGAAPTVLALVGATGVGKTTNAAKLAAWFSLHENRRVALVSMDCYRIGATDQLRTYGRIMHLPCEVALQKKDLRMALARHQDKDLIIIDTAGKSPYDPGHIDELADWFCVHPRIEPYLTVSATAKKEDLSYIIDSYKALEPSGLMLTKLDETRAYAALCQQVAVSALPVSCLSTGQRVPEDFVMASRGFMDTLFKKGWNAALAGMQKGCFAGQWC